MDIFAQNDYRRIRLHASRHNIRHDVDEFSLFKLAGESGLFFDARALQFIHFAADADIPEVRTGPQCRLNAAPSCFASWIGFSQSGNRSLHRSSHPFLQGRDPFRFDQLPLDHVACHQLQRIAIAPLLFFFFGAVAERASRERAVLVEEAVNVRLNDRRALTRTHVGCCFFHGKVHGEWVHAVDLPTRNGECLASC
jgi:hypothetical protein